MIKIDTVEITGWEAAIRGMRITKEQALSGEALEILEKDND